MRALKRSAFDFITQLLDVAALFAGRLLETALTWN